MLQVSAAGTAPPPRHNHHLHVHNDLLYLFGGINDLGVSTVSLFKTTLPRQQVDRACALANAAAFGESPGIGGAEDAQQEGSEAAGGPAASMSSSAAVLQLEWQELEADLPYNKSRAAVMQQGQLRCYQLGSATLGRSINDDDAERGECWHANQNVGCLVPGRWHRTCCCEGLALETEAQQMRQYDGPAAS